MSKFIVFFVRIGSFFYRLKLKPLAWLVSYFVRIVFSCQISPGAKFGRRVKLAYGGLGTVIHGNTIIGDDCIIGTNVTLGGNFGIGGVPRIGSRSYIATGAKVLGSVVVGEDSIVGANAVVTKDVPSGCVVAGVPARIIRKRENINIK